LSRFSRTDAGDESDFSSELSVDSDGGDDGSESAQTTTGSSASSRDFGAILRSAHGKEKVKRRVGRGQGLRKPSGSSSSGQDSDTTPSSSSSRSLEEEFGLISFSSKVNKSSDESVMSLTLPSPAPPVAEFLPPQSRVQGAFPGSSGRPCKIETNHFAVNLRPQDILVYVYDVIIEPPWKRPFKKCDIRLYQDTIRMWKDLCPVVRSNKNAWVFDGVKQIYSLKKLKEGDFKPVEILVYSYEEEKDVKMWVRELEIVSSVMISQDVKYWAEKGRSGGVPQDALQVIDVVLKQSLSVHPGFESIARSYFSIDGSTLDVGFGKEVWVGTFSTVRPYGWKKMNVLLTLNVDTANKPATKNLHLTDESKPGAADSYIHEVLRSRRGERLNFSKGLMDHHKKMVGKDLEGLKVLYEVPVEGEGVRKRQYRVLTMRDLPADKEMIEVDGKKVSVVTYFKDQYKVKLRYPKLPCLWVGSRDKQTYLPTELCTMIAQSMPKKKKLPDDSIAAMIKQTALPPQDRKKKIMEGLEMNSNKFKNDPYVKEFGISVSGEMTKLSARVLDAPAIEYKEEPKLRNVVNINAQNPGKWKQEKNQYKDGKRVSNWAFIDFSNLKEDEYRNIAGCFQTVGKDSGLTFSNPPCKKVQSSMQNLDDALFKIEKLMKELIDFGNNSNKSLDLIVILFAYKAGPLYDRVKQLGDLKYGVTTQCCLKQTLFRQGKLNAQVVANLCLKINSKLGGINHVLAKSCRPSVLSKPVMILGADVSHPAPESRRAKPSIAAIVGSVEPTATVYEVEIRLQDAGYESNEEVIQDLKSTIKNLLVKFYTNNSGRKPGRLIMYRDGCSEGQFLAVLSNEVKAIRDACSQLEEGYQPAVTFIVVQKRHHTRFFPMDNNKYRNGNALAGTVVDQGISHPTEGDFYLLSHEGIQGTSRPCHYHLLWDDSNFSANELETLTYYLCHLYSRCTRAVSYPTPTYYAHLVAERARKHHNELSSMLSGQASVKEVAEVRKKVEQGAQKAMYFV